MASILNSKNSTWNQASFNQEVSNMSKCKAKVRAGNKIMGKTDGEIIESTCDYLLPLARLGLVEIQPGCECNSDKADKAEKPQRKRNSMKTGTVDMGRPTLQVYAERDSE
jgi:hypothetical protein